MADEYTFRRAGIDDAATVRTLTRAAYAKWLPVIGREPLPMSADYDAAVRKHQIDMLSDAGALVGLVEMALRDDHVLVVNVAVAPEAQGRGVGHVLMAHAEDVARGAGLMEMRLYTNQKFVENIRLYEKLGYAIDREEPFGDGFVTYMSKRL